MLCGSRKYPVKEPFVELMKGSLNTFLNAMTFPDKTCYPIASQSLRDFYNLIDVYLDAAFYPRITPNAFQQEGWHYELDAIDAPLLYKGVVFNEMKGSYSSPDDRLNEFSQRSLFPDTVYGLDSGGDPRQIPDLTYADSRHFISATTILRMRDCFSSAMTIPTSVYACSIRGFAYSTRLQSIPWWHCRNAFPHHGDCRGPLLRALGSPTGKQW